MLQRCTDLAFPLFCFLRAERRPEDDNGAGSVLDGFRVIAGVFFRGCPVAVHVSSSRLLLMSNLVCKKIFPDFLDRDVEQLHGQNDLALRPADNTVQSTAQGH